jgi:hypothetical protein
MPNHSAFQNEVVNYAYEISSHNKEFLYTLKAENGTFDPERISKPNKDGYRDYGLCQMHYPYHKEFIDSPEFHDWKLQLLRCWQIYEDAGRRGRLRTTFYGYNKISAMKHFFKFNE